MASDTATSTAENHASGGDWGVQTGYVDKGEINNTISGAEVLPRRALKVRRATPDERRQVEQYFVEPGGVTSADHWLSPEEPLLVLCGEGTGRDYTAMRLLFGHGASEV